MQAAAHARAVGAASRFVVSLAGPADDGAMARLLSASAFPGDVRVSLERSPSPLAAGVIDGDVHQTIVARDGRNGALAAMASRSVRDTFLNGSNARVGYFGQLRVVSGGVRLRALLDEGWAFCRALHDTGDARVYLASLVAGQAAAVRLLRLSPRAPAFSRLSPLTTFAIPASRRLQTPPPSGVRLETGSAERIPAIAACLERNLRRYQLAPRWTAADLLSHRTRGLAPEDFVVAMRPGRPSGVVGCLAQWDQTAFKQVVVRGYSARLRAGRPLVNLMAPWLGVPHLPDPGQPLPFAYLSHAAVDHDRQDVFAALVAEQRRRAAEAGRSHVVAAFAPGHPFHAAIARGSRHRSYETELYLAAWADGVHVVRSFDARAPQPEVALL